MYFSLLNTSFSMAQKGRGCLPQVCISLCQIIAQLYIYIYIYIYTHTHTHTHTHTYVCMYVRMYVCMYVYMYVCMYGDLLYCTEQYNYKYFRSIFLKH
jgi:hypothetical protein